MRPKSSNKNFKTKDKTFNKSHTSQDLPKIFNINRACQAYQLFDDIANLYAINMVIFK